MCEVGSSERVDIRYTGNIPAVDLDQTTGKYMQGSKEVCRWFESGWHHRRPRDCVLRGSATRSAEK